MEGNFICPHCGALNDELRGCFCTKCGAPLQNSCTNKDCENYDPVTADIMSTDCYCPLCGSMTVFKQGGWVVPDD